MPGPTSTPLDATDLHLLELLQADADRTLRELGDEVGLSPSAVQRRIGRYRRSGLLARLVAVLDPAHGGSLVLAVVLVTLREETVALHGAFAERLRASPDVQQAYAVSGRWDYVAVLIAGSVRACREVGNELFRADENVRRYETLLVFDTVKSGLGLPAHALLPRP